MTASAGPNAGIVSGWSNGENSWGADMNANLKRIDATLFLSVLAAQNTPPVSPTLGDRYIVTATATGAWEDHETEVARWDGAAWEFIAPAKYWRANVVGVGVHKFDGSAWVAQFGYGDLAPISIKDDGSGGFGFATSPAGRPVFRALGTGPAASIVAVYHVPHEIKRGQADGDSFMHLHCEFESQAAGDVIITATIYAALRDGAWSSPFTATWTMTPANYALNTHHVIEIALPNGVAAYLDVDSVIVVKYTRDSGLAGDTYTGAFYFDTADIHTQFDQLLTTSKDKGSDWVKAI